MMIRLRSMESLSLTATIPTTPWCGAIQKILFSTERSMQHAMNMNLQQYMQCVRL